MILPHVNMKLVLCCYAKTFQRSIFEGSKGCYLSFSQNLSNIQLCLHTHTIACHKVPAHSVLMNLHGSIQATFFSQLTISINHLLCFHNTSNKTLTAFSIVSKWNLTKVILCTMNISTSSMYVYQHHPVNFFIWSLLSLLSQTCYVHPSVSPQHEKETPGSLYTALSDTTFTYKCTQ